MDPISTPLLAALAAGRLSRRGWLLLANLVATPPASAVALTATAFVSYRRAKAALDDLQDDPHLDRAQRLEQALQARVAADPTFRNDIAAWAAVVRTDLAQNPDIARELKSERTPADEMHTSYEVHFDFRHPTFHGQVVNGVHQVR
ncbi:hypothetical protein [Embleya hyalina]|uniref:Uncharacterized protein n=1 Tax=Embleya hyalina TaxID=516124 RepID=A0A401Z2F5_9ACTN|nr:hypothetical protein [Embleya hyalina]GCE01032.1 hypothetical protein EHYA_08771 [Embleya hyalina]